jgi:hypothetical protein
MISFPIAAPSAVMRMIRRKLPGVNPKAMSSAEAIKVYEAPKNGVALEMSDTTKSPARLKRKGLLRWAGRSFAASFKMLYANLNCWWLV